ncbi:MAG: AraC family transcriptional regulator [Paludibacteraceae bacterium]|nr:AraC family transcriptional regulator [Paludibacteraceae bacterium]
MFYQIIKPSKSLHKHINRYVFVRAEGSTDTMQAPSDDPRFINGKHVQPLLPNYGSMICVRNAIVKIADIIADGVFLLGANQTTITLTTMSGWFEGLLIDFEPGGMHALFGIDMQQLCGKVRNNIQCKLDLNTIEKIFKETPDAENIALKLDIAFGNLLSPQDDINYSRICKVVSACDSSNGDISATEMAQTACLSERQFLRIFKQYVGISPKQFIRLRRFHSTLQDMQQQAAKGEKIDLLSTILNHGYYDLSHAALEFQQMGCLSPSHFRMLGIPLTDDFSIFFA